jgi:hypothetical protein
VTVQTEDILVEVVLAEEFPRLDGRGGADTGLHRIVAVDAERGIPAGVRLQAVAG